MTWHMSTKTDGRSGMGGSYTITIPIHVTAQVAGANATYEVPLWSPAHYIQQTGYAGAPGTNASDSLPFTGTSFTHVILAAYIIPITTITGGGATVTATATIQLYTAAGASVGVLFSKAYTTGVNATALTASTLGTPSTTVRPLSGGCSINKDEVLTFKWVQSATTGLALPDSTIVLDIV